MLLAPTIPGKSIRYWLPPSKKNGKEEDHSEGMIYHPEMTSLFDWLCKDLSHVDLGPCLSITPMILLVILSKQQQLPHQHRHLHLQHGSTNCKQHSPLPKNVSSNYKRNNLHYPTNVSRYNQGLDEYFSFRMDVPTRDDRR